MHMAWSVLLDFLPSAHDLDRDWYVNRLSRQVPFSHYVFGHSCCVSQARVKSHNCHLHGYCRVRMPCFHCGCVFKHALWSCTLHFQYNLRTREVVLTYIEEKYSHITNWYSIVIFLDRGTIVPVSWLIDVKMLENYVWTERYQVW